MKINLGIGQKRYTRDMSFDNNTSYGFGECQPNMCQFMLPDSDISVNAKQLVRLSPLIAPSFARVSLHTYARFVPISEIFAPFECLLSNIPYKSSRYTSSKIPTKIPHFPLNGFFYYLLPYCDITLYKDGLSKDNIVLSGYSTSDLPLYVFIETLVPASSSVSGAVKVSSTSLLQNKVLYVSAESADYIYEFSNERARAKYTYMCIKLNQKGQILRKILVGLGYDICASSNVSVADVSLLPLLAYYKAYFDTFSTNRSLGWSSTSCYSIIDAFSETYYDSLSTYFVDNILKFDEKMAAFFEELANTYYADPTDYISMHTSKPLNNTDLVKFSVVGSGSDFGTLSVGSAGGSMPFVGSADVGDLDQNVLNTLRVLTKYLTKDSVIGKRIDKWVRVHFNADVANQLFKETNFVHRSSLPLQISDVFSTSDTADASTNTGEHLGAYAGKGIGYGNCKFKFHSNVHGYLVVFSCIVPESRTFQGIDPTLFALDRFQLPQKEFDALGYEITDKRCFIGSNDIYTTDKDNTNAFGYCPRYSSFKYRKNIVNGDMSRRSVMSTLMPYYLDRYMINRYVGSDDGGSTSIHRNTIPTASEEWRYSTKYPWLSNFNRLFISYVNYGLIPESQRAWWTQSDNFIAQSIFNVSLKDCLKPMKSSYDTFDEDVDTSTTSVASV